MALAAGTRIGPYEIAALLGVGGMGEVYRARDTRLAREVAIKVLPTSFAGDADRLRRFEQEARATGLLNHPNILQVHDVGSHEGAPYVVSELLEGETLRDRIGGTPLPVRKAIDFATQIARGLSAAHEKGIVHRDLKPENLFLTRDGRVKILDFGLAKLVHGEALSEAETNTHGMPGTDAGKVLGTVGYMSPEQVRAQPVDHRSDIFSFGCILYEVATGRRPFAADSHIDTMHGILHDKAPPIDAINPAVPSELRRLIRRCMEKNPEQRLQSSKDLALELREIVDEYDVLSASATSGSAIAAPALRPRRNPIVLGAVGLGATLGLAALVFWLVSQRAGGPRPARPCSAPPPASVCRGGSCASSRRWNQPGTASSASPLRRGCSRTRRCRSDDRRRRRAPARATCSRPCRPPRRHSFRPLLRSRRRA